MDFFDVPGMGDISDAVLQSLFDQDSQNSACAEERHPATQPDKPSPAFAPSFAPVFGTWLDDCLCLRDKAGARLCKMVLLRLELFERDRRQRRRSDKNQRNFEILVECIVANALRAVYYRAYDRVAYMRKADAEFYRFKPDWLSAEAMARTVDLMVDAELLTEWRGVPGVVASTYNIGHALIDLIVASAVEMRHVGRRPPARRSLIILRSRGKQKRQIKFDPTEETDGWAAMLDRYNRFIERHNIKLDLSQDEKKAFVQAAYDKRPYWDDQPKMVEPEFFRRHVYRIYNDGRWDHGGRLYRAWWITTPGKLRKKITIDGESTVELDYSGFLPRSIYHQHGIDYPANEEPYEISMLSAYAEWLDQPPDYFRKSIKKLLVALLNGENRDGHPEMVRLEQTFKPAFNRLEVEELIAAKHPFLAEMFRTGKGKCNQRLDSDIAMDILAKLMDRGILALPIHDSFIVQERHKEVLYNTMVESYQKKLNYSPTIKVNSQ